MTIRRALLFMPGDSRRKIEKGAKLDVDTIIMDLEDGVALNNKVSARETVIQALCEMNFGRSERLVRTNMIIPDWIYTDDIRVTVAGRPDGYVLPKIESAEQIDHVSLLLSAYEEQYGWKQHSIKLFAIIETAKGVINLKEIVQASPRLAGLMFGAEDLAGDMGATRTPQGWEVFYARSAVVTYAKAFGLDAIDTVFINLHTDESDLITETKMALQMGYTGKLAIHPNQIAPIQSVFTPTEDEIDSAQRLIDAHEHHQASGTGVFEYEGKMIDMPMVRSALAIINRARACGLV